MTRLAGVPRTDRVERRGSNRHNAVTGFHGLTFYLGRTGSNILVIAESEFLREVCEPLITYIGNGAQMGEPPLEFVQNQEGRKRRRRNEDCLDCLVAN